MAVGEVVAEHGDGDGGCLVAVADHVLGVVDDAGLCGREGAGDAEGEGGAGVDGVAVHFDDESDAGSLGEFDAAREAGEGLAVDFAVVLVVASVEASGGAEADEGRVGEDGAVKDVAELLEVGAGHVGGEAGKLEAVVGEDAVDLGGAVGEVLGGDVVDVVAPEAGFGLGAEVVADAPDAEFKGVEAEFAEKTALSGKVQ